MRKYIPLFLALVFLFGFGSISRRDYGPGLWSVGNIVVTERTDENGDRIIDAQSIDTGKVERIEERNRLRRKDLQKKDVSDLLYELDAVQASSDWDVINPLEPPRAEDNGARICYALRDLAACEEIASYILWATAQPGLYSMSGELGVYRDCVEGMFAEGETIFQDFVELLRQRDWGNPKAKIRTFEYDWRPRQARMYPNQEDD